MENINQAVKAGPAKAGINKGGKIMKLLGFELRAVKSSGHNEEKNRDWTKVEILGKSVNGVEKVKLTLWGHEASVDKEDGTTDVYMVYQSSPVEKGSKLRKKWWIPCSPNNPKLVETTSSKGNVYKEVLPEGDIPKGWDIKAFFYDEVGEKKESKVGVSIKIVEKLI